MPHYVPWRCLLSEFFVGMWNVLEAIAARTARGVTILVVAIAAVAGCRGDGDVGALEARARAGDRVAQYSLGMRFLHGSGVPQDAARARTWLERSAEQGFAYGQYQLAVLELRHHGARGREAVRKLLAAAYAGGAAPARDALATLLATDPGSTKSDGARAVALLEGPTHDAARPSAAEFEALAAAYARAGRFAEAVGAQREAIEQLRCECARRDVSEHMRRLAAYQRGEAWVDAGH